MDQGRQDSNRGPRLALRVAWLVAGAALVGCSAGNADKLVWGRTPSVAPDGATMVFCQNLSTPSDRLTGTVSVLDAGAVWRCATDGANAVKLTPGGRGPDFYPTISPDGTRIAFISAEDRQFDLWVANIDGSGRHKLTFDLASDTLPAWSPDGRRIAFVSDRAGNSDIWVINTDGGGLRPLVAFASDEASPAFSPDGTQLAFSSTRDRGNFDIWVIGTDGSGLRQVTRKEAANTRITDGNPDWSRPDGAQIIFQRWDGNWDVYRCQADGSGLTQLTQDGDHQGDPRFAPDGSIFFTSSRSGWWQIWRMAADGSDQRQITGRR
jgi:Tol biopolymer transport system component